MTLLEAIAWGAGGVVAYAAVDIRSHLPVVKERKWRSFDWPTEILAFIGRVIVGVGSVVILNGASQPLSPATALIVGAAAPSILAQLGRYPAAVENERRQIEILNEAEQLSKVRESQTDVAIPQGVSTETAHILAARREALMGELPVVDLDDEGRAAS